MRVPFAKVRPQLPAMLLALGLAAMLVGCGKPSDPSKSANILKRGNGQEPATLDPHTMTGMPEFNVAWALFEGLTELDPETLAPRPAAAASWEILEDGLLYRFHIRPEAKWTNGEPLTAQDFVFGWERVLSPGLGGSYATYLHCIEGAGAFNRGETTDFSTVAVRAVDAKTLEVRLSYPTPHFLVMMSLPFSFPVNRLNVLAYGEMDERDTKWTRAGNMVSNGPFQLTAWQPNQILSVRKNPHYWQIDTVRLDGIDFHPIASQQTEERVFRTGDLQLTNSLAINKIARYQSKNPELLHMTPFFGTYFYRFNTTRAPLSDPRVRRALTMAIDRDDIVANVARGGQSPAYCFVPPGTRYEPAEGLRYNVEEARRLLAEAGFPDGKGFPELKLLYNTSENHRSVAEALQHMWKTKLGISISLVNQDWKVYLSSVRQLDYDIARGSWIGDYVDPHNFLEVFKSDCAHNRTGWSNQAYDALIDKALHTADDAARFATLREAESIMLRDAPIAPVYFYVSIYLMAPELREWHANLLNYPSYKVAYLASAE